MCGTLGSMALALKPNRSERSIVKPAASIAAPVSRAGWQPPAMRGPQAAAVGELEDRPLGLAARDHVLVEAQLAAGAQHAVQLGERAAWSGTLHSTRLATAASSSPSASGSRSAVPAAPSP